MTTTILLIAGFLALVGLYLVLTRRRPDGLEDYFEAAVRVAVWRDDAPAMLAALVAAKVAAPRQRMAMTTFLAQLSGQFQRVAVRASKGDECQARLQELAAKLGDEAWRAADADEARAALGEVDPALLAGLEQGDPAVFRERHPELFAVSSLLDLVELDKPDKRGSMGRLFGP